MRSIASYSFNNSTLIGVFHEKEVSFKNGIFGGKITQDRRSEGQRSQSQNRLTRGRVLSGNKSRGGEDVHSDADTAGWFENGRKCFALWAHLGKDFPDSCGAHGSPRYCRDGEPCCRRESSSPRHGRH